MEDSFAARLPALATIKTYYSLTKPGIIRGNALTAIAGFLLAANGKIDIGLFLTTLTGLSLIIASGCVCNNYIDRGIDSHMDRTRERALVNGTVSNRSALLYAAWLGLLGTFLLVAYTNLLTAALGVFGFVAYVVVYGIAKRRSVHGTVVGSISGAIPPVVGYSAVTGRLDLGALSLFVILVLWQMPHFYAIAMYRLQDYKAAGIPVLPAKYGLRTTKFYIIAYIVAFTAAVTSLSIFGYAGYTYLVVSTLLGLTWLYVGIQGFRTQQPKGDIRWARKMFGVSLVVISLLCLVLSLATYLP